MVRGRIPEDRAEDILNAARHLLLEKGRGGVTMESVALRAGVGKGTIFLYWPSKAHLMDALFSLELVELLKKVRLALADQPEACCLSFLMRQVLQAQILHPILDVIFRDKGDTQKLDDKILEQEVRRLIPIARAQHMLKPVTDEEVAVGIESMMLGLLHVNYNSQLNQISINLPEVIERMVSSTYELPFSNSTVALKMAQEFDQGLTKMIHQLTQKSAPIRKKRAGLAVSELGA
jgi:AcrR family transcriptional regulator